MGLFDHFPYTNVHELNLDWVLSMMKALEAEWEAFTAGNSLTFADPIQHDISKTYAKNTIVLDGTGNAYVSLQPVPVGVSLDNQDYWLMVFDYEAFIEKVNKNFTARYYRGNYRATAAMAIGDWLTVDDVLCKATAAIAIDDVLEVGVNITHFTLEDFITAFMQSANQLIQQYKNDIDASEDAYRQQLAQDIANTTASLQHQLDLAISGATVDSEVINARLGADGVTYPTLGDAIRTQFTDTNARITEDEKTKDVLSTIVRSTYNRQLHFNNPASTDNLDVIDENGNIIASIDYQGNIKTKGFDSHYAADQFPLYANDTIDFAIMDPEFNMVFAISKGLAITNQNLYGKKLSISGDSICSYNGQNPAGYQYYYPNGDVNNVSKTWWKMLATELGLDIIANASWAGGRVAGDSQGSGYYGLSDTRVADLKGANNETPDIIIVYLGTNDWNASTTLGSFDSHDDIPAEGVITSVAPAYALMLYKLRVAYPKAQIYCILNMEGRKLPDDTTYPVENSNGDTIHEFNHSIAEIAHIFGAHIIDLETSGINFWNIGDYTIDSINTHPNYAGMKIIKDVVKMKLLETFKTI